MTLAEQIASLKADSCSAEKRHFYHFVYIKVPIRRLRKILEPFLSSWFQFVCLDPIYWTPVKHMLLSL